MLEGKAVLVTGAGSGIGRQSALALARYGARVAVADVVVAGGNETVEMIRGGGGEAFFAEADVSLAESVEAMVAAVVDRFGRIDAAHNNAGIEGVQAPTADCTEENWDRVLGINLKGIWLCMRAEIPRMVAGGGGSIVNTASIAGLVGFQGLTAYSASKFGVVGITKVAALEYAPAGIRVNAVCPGVIRTPMIDRLVAATPEMAAGLTAATPLGRLGEPEEIAEAVAWLCSDRASYVTGAALPVDGAFTAQ